MVGRPGKFQPRFTAGALDQYLQANTEVDAYAKGAALMRNARPLPQGGFTLADGLTKIDRLRNGLNPVAFVGVVPSSVPGVGGGTVVATLPFAAMTPITAVDLSGFAASLPAGGSPGWTPPNPPESPLVAGTVTVNYLDASGAWTQLGPSVALTDSFRTRRFALPPGQSVLASRIQVVVDATTPGGVTFWFASAGAVSVWVEGATPPGAVKLRPFTLSAANAYDLVFTPGNVEVYAASGRVASLPFPISNAQVREFQSVQQLATMIVTHRSFQPVQIQRQGADTEWQIQTAPFRSIPNYDFGDVVYTNFTPAVWQLTFFNFDTQLGTGTAPLPSGGVHYHISVNGVAAAAVQQTPGSWTGTAAAIQAAILSVPGVSAGVTVALGTSTTNITSFTVTMGGAGNAGDGWAISGTPIDKSDAAITAAKTTVGVPGGEPIMSAARGWPGACVLYQERLGLGGFAGVPLGILWSATGDVYELDTRLVAATAPILMVLDGQGDETILSLHLGRTLDVFTTYGEWWVQPGAMSATSVPAVAYATSNGIAASVQPVESEGVTLYTYASGGVLAEFYYEYQFQNYTSEPISTQASSLISGVVDNDLQRATETVDTNVHWIVTSAGMAVLRATSRHQQINAYAQRKTDGSFLAVDVNARAEANFAVARHVDGQVVVFLERATPGLVLDCAETIAVTAGQATIAGLDDYVGVQMWAIVDGYVQGPFQIDASASIALAFPALADGSATVGRWTPPIVTTLPVPRDIGPRTVLRRPARVHAVRLNLVESGNVAIGANGNGPWECPLLRFGGAADTPLSAQPYTGWAALEGLYGFDDDAQVTITQTRPGALTVTGVTIEVDL